MSLGNGFGCEQVMTHLWCLPPVVHGLAHKRYALDVWAATQLVICDRSPTLR
jgi:hypothetical protein